MYTLIDLTVFQILFEWDCEQKEDAEHNTEWTEHPVESGAVVSDYGNNKPDIYNVEGYMTATPFGSPIDETRLGDAHEKLKRLRDKRQELTLLAGNWTPTVVITKVGAVQGTDDAGRLLLSASFKTVDRPQPKTVDIPPSRLKPKVRRRASTKTKKGGAATGKPATATQTKSIAAGLKDRDVKKVLKQRLGL